jgi:PAS domain S-box-containing protein
MPAQLAVPARDGQGSPHALILLAREPRAWPEYYLPRLSLLAALFVSALDRKRASETRDQLAGNADLLQSVRAIVWRADARTFQTTFVSREAEAILGYPVESWLRVPGFWTSHIHPDDREWVVAFSGRATREHRKHDFEYRMIVADGRTVWLRNIVNVLVEGGEAAELVGVTVDITERKLAEIEADRLRHQFTQAQRVTSLGELAVTLAHELNQPLGANVSNAEAAQVFLSRTPPARDRVLPILADIVQDARRAGDVLHRARRLLQHQPIELLPLDVARTIAEVVALARALALSRRVDVASHVAPGLPRPAADAVQVQQVLLNLVFNAMDAVEGRPEGRRQVSIDAAARDGWVELTVTDSGDGIPPERLPQVFDPFFTTKSGGMGMGLAICRSIVQAHGGDIALENTAGGGARVRVRLPAGG